MKSSVANNESVAYDVDLTMQTSELAALLMVAPCKTDKQEVNA